jgi:hypothetical protein
VAQLCSKQPRLPVAVLHQLVANPRDIGQTDSEVGTKRPETPRAITAERTPGYAHLDMLRAVSASSVRRLFMPPLRPIELTYFRTSFIHVSYPAYDANTNGLAGYKMGEERSSSTGREQPRPEGTVAAIGAEVVRQDPGVVLLARGVHSMSNPSAMTCQTPFSNRRRPAVSSPRDTHYWRTRS